MARRHKKRTSRKRKRLLNSIEKPFCYYCNRSFENEQVLHSHQRARHFTCPHCGRKFSLALSLGMHMYQTHDDPLKTVINAIPGRDDPQVPISGMNGIPADAMLDRLKGLYDDETETSVRYEIEAKVLELGGSIDFLKQSSSSTRRSYETGEMERSQLQTSKSQQGNFENKGTLISKLLAERGVSLNAKAQILVHDDDTFSVEEKRYFYLYGDKQIKTEDSSVNESNSKSHDDLSNKPDGNASEAEAKEETNEDAQPEQTAPKSSEEAQQ